MIPWLCHRFIIHLTFIIGNVHGDALPIKNFSSLGAKYVKQPTYTAISILTSFRGMLWYVWYSALFKSQGAKIPGGTQQNKELKIRRQIQTSTMGSL